MVKVGTRIVCVEIFEHCVRRWVRTYPPMDRDPSVGGLGLVMNKYWVGGGGRGEKGGRETRYRQ